VVSEHWVDHRECYQLIDLQIVLHWRFLDQRELLVSILVLDFRLGVFRSERAAVDVVKFVVFVGVSQWRSASGS
jgi:hypothetical protein